MEGQKRYESVQGEMAAPSSSPAWASAASLHSQVNPTPLAQPPEGDVWPKAAHSANPSATVEVDEGAAVEEGTGEADDAAVGTEVGVHVLDTSAAAGTSELDAVAMAVTVAVAMDSATGVDVADAKAAPVEVAVGSDCINVELAVAAAEAACA